MTGYGYAEYGCENFTLTLEMKSYNNRYLDISYNAPSALSSFETEVTDRIKEICARGHVDVSFKLRTLKQMAVVSVDEDAASSYAKAASRVAQICKAEGLDASFSLSDVLNQEGVLTDIRQETADTYKDAVQSCLSTALAALDQSRRREGSATRADLEKMINGIEKSLNSVRSHAAELENQIKCGLKKRIDEMLGDKDYDENRVLTEVAVLLMKYTVNEEISRLDIHIKEFRRLLGLDEAVGKRADFLCQEMNREINTIGSKSQMVEVSLAVVDMKDCLENIREQVRNIE